MTELKAGAPVTAITRAEQTELLDPLLARVALLFPDWHISQREQWVEVCTLVTQAFTAGKQAGQARPGG